jgi:anti-sigma factor RsiW
VSDPITIHDQLELYTAGVLTTEETIAFDDHLLRCRRCQARATHIFEVAAALIPDSPAPEQTWARIVSAIERR